MLGGLLAPTEWRTLEPAQFEKCLLEWELSVLKYEAQSGKVFGDDNRVAVVLKLAPKESKPPLMSGHPGNRNDYNLLRTSIMQLVKGGVDHDASGKPMSKDNGGQENMQVGAIGGGSKGDTQPAQVTQPAKETQPAQVLP